MIKNIYKCKAYYASDSEEMFSFGWFIIYFFLFYLKWCNSSNSNEFLFQKIETFQPMVISSIFESKFKL